MVAFEVIDRLASAASLFKVVDKDDHIEVIDKATGKTTPIFSQSPLVVADLVVDAVLHGINSQVDFDWYAWLAKKEAKKKAQKK